MEHKELMEVLQKEWQKNKKECETILKTLLQLIGDAATMMHCVTIADFGTFSPIKTAERVVEDNDTHTSVLMPPEIRLTYTNTICNEEGSEQTITENDLATLLSKRTTIPQEESLQLVTTLFCTIAQACEHGESVVVHNFGVFSSQWIASSERYEREFAPDKQMREWVNAPFAAFIPEQLSTPPTEEEVVAVEEETVEEEKLEEETVVATESTPKPIEKKSTAKLIIPPTKKSKKRRRRKSRNGKKVGMLFAILLLIGAIIGSYLLLFTEEQQKVVYVMTEVKSKTTIEQQPAIVEVEQTEVEIVEVAVVDTIRQGVFMTTLALKHYGDKAFWVYIYQENKASIKNPNAVPPNTPVVIPPKGKYQIDAANPAAIERADSLAEEIKKTL